ncbi:hypothetical protein [Hymenobacter elongatus]|uniref:Uncharacterized protein n=1 Tax=Hymenobacter elongatus TaxID=877208 RepID=A0A4Z0PS72_9BACT|nr:hypothetical protein [Hymenobacter elongatus]TGE20169.1 hypothetical protein E5J99_00955 [Hymenobacter elongatus]
MARALQILCKGIAAVAAVVGAWYILAVGLLDEDNITHLAGHYYTAGSDNGYALHWYENESTPYGGTLLEPVYDTRMSGKYLVARAGVDFYFLYPLSATSQEDASRQRRGPFLKEELNQKLLQLTADTVLRQVGPF